MTGPGRGRTFLLCDTFEREEREARMGRISVHRKGYERKGYTRSDGTRVAAARVASSDFMIRDRGKPGRGPKVIPKLKAGKLGGPGFLKRPLATQKRLLSKSVGKSRRGYRSTLGRLQAIANFGKRTFTPTQKARIRSLRRWVVKKYGEG